MRVAVVGASGKTGIKVVGTALDRGYDVVAVCRDTSVERLQTFRANERLRVEVAPVVSNEAVLNRALDGCDAVIAVLISVRRLKATELVMSLAKAASANDVRRFVFTAGEVTAVREPGERFTLRQWLLRSLGPLIASVTPYSMTDMIRASTVVRRQSDWDWTIIRAPMLRDTPAAGYRWCELAEITARDALSREDYAACLLDSISNPAHYHRSLTVISAAEGRRPHDG